MNTKNFPLLKFKGGNYDIGLQHGKALTGQIQFCFDAYKKMLFFDIAENKLKEIGNRYLDCFSNFKEEYADEVRGIAAGAGMEPWQIAAMNARNEILHYQTGRPALPECTAIYLSQCSVLAQNWDWAREYEDLAFIVSRENNDGHKTLEMCEPGIIGKIGLNSSGVGVCINFLSGCKNSIGIPLHFLSRVFLDSVSLEEAKENAVQADVASFSNVLVGDDKGEFFDLEICERQKSFLPSHGPDGAHTNHYLGQRDKRFIAEDPVGRQLENLLHENSVTRYARVLALLTQTKERDLDTAKKILSDRENEKDSILREFEVVLPEVSVGTVTSVVMDLKNRVMHITKGNPIRHAYEIVSIDAPSDN